MQDTKPEVHVVHEESKDKCQLPVHIDQGLNPWSAPYFALFHVSFCLSCVAIQPYAALHDLLGPLDSCY